ncbi:MAG: endonuclease domain-containing protein [Patescibacteria group bacterium]
MPIFYNHPQQRTLRKQLRRQATPTEVMLWHHLRGRRLLGYKFRRQHSIGRYVLDFYCPELRLGIEVDGGQHSDRVIAENDAMRSEWLKHFRVTVVRFNNADVMNNRSGVIERLEEIISVLETQRHHPRPPVTPS